MASLKLGRGFAFFLVFALSLLTDQPPGRAASALPSPFVIAPYLFAASAGHLQLAWQYDPSFAVADPVSVKLAGGPAPVTGVARHDGPLLVADLPMPVCGFGSHITYQVPGMQWPQAIAPIPCPNDPAPARFSFIADAQEGVQHVRDFAVQMAQFNGSAVLSAGDLVETGASYRDWVGYHWAMQPFTAGHVELAAIGNHEYRSKPETNFWQHFFQTDARNAHYSFYVGAAHIIVLNSCFEDEPSVAESQLPWLTQQLAAPARWKIVVFHHPPYSRGVLNNDRAPRKEHVFLQARYVPLFEAMGADLVLTGHTHLFERSVRNGIQYLVAGPAGGKMGFYGARNPYSLHAERVRTASHFEVTANYLDAVTLGEAGERIDAFRLTKN